MSEKQLFPPLRIDQIIEGITTDSPIQDFHIDRFESFRQVIRHATFPHRHDFYNIILFTAGSGRHRIDFHDYEIRAGVTFFLTPGQIHSWELSDDVQGYNILFSRNFIERNCAYPPLLELPYFHSLDEEPLLKNDADRIERPMHLIYYAGLLAITSNYLNVLCKRRKGGSPFEIWLLIVMLVLLMF